MRTDTRNWAVLASPLSPPEHSAWQRRALSIKEGVRRAFEAVVIDLAYLVSYGFETVDRAAEPATETLARINPWGRHATFARWFLIWCFAVVLLLY